MSGIICWIFTLAIPVLQFDLAQWRNDLNKIQGRASHSNIATYDESYWQDASSYKLQWTRWRDITEVKIHGDLLKEKDRSRWPDKATDLFEASDHHFHEQFMESFSSTHCSKLVDDRAWSSQEWKTENYDVRSIKATWYNFLQNGQKSSTWSRRNSRRNRAIRNWNYGSNFFCFWNLSQISDRTGRPVDVKRNQISREDHCDGEYWFCSLKCPVLASRSFVVCVRRQWSSDLNYH